MLKFKAEPKRCISATAPIAPSLTDNAALLDLLDEPGPDEVMRRVKPSYVVHLAAVGFVAYGDIA